jgi:hypothetical protein
MRYRPCWVLLLYPFSLTPGPHQEKERMPPKKHLPDAPVIFSLRLPTEESVPQPAGAAATNYADILQDIETSQVSNRFTTDTMRDILGRIRSPTYGQNVACLWCCHPFPWKASMIPISYDAYENMYTCEGNFCSPECAMASLYGDPSISDTTRWSRHALLVDLYRSLYPTRELTQAPPRTTLRMFGGPLDIEQFRQYIASSEDMVAVHLPPIRLHLPSMNVQGPVRDVKKFVALSQETVDKANKELRLKRSKPMHANVQTLDKCMSAPTLGVAM